MFHSLLTAFLLLVSLAAPACAQESRTIVVATDMHFISPALTDHGAYFTDMVSNSDGKLVMYCDELIEAFIDQVIDTHPNCVILSGDVTFNGAKKSHEDLAERLRRIRKAGIPVYVIPGNHDIQSGAAASFHGDSYTRVESVTQKEFESIYRDFGFAQAVSRDPYSLSYIAEPFPGLRVLMLDTNVPSATGAVTGSTLVWLKDALAKAQADGAKIVAVTHHNLYAHSSLLSKGFVISNADALLRLYKQYGVSINFSGHMHMQHTMHTDDGGIPEIASSSLAVAPCQYGVITIAGDHAQYRTESTDVAAWAKKNGKTNEHLLDFAGFAERFFKGTSDMQPAKAYASENERAIGELVSDINFAYFSGRMDQLPEDVSILGDWLKQSGFFSAYIASILADEARNHTELRFEL